jgi:uncharacterized membrane protein
MATVNENARSVSIGRVFSRGFGVIVDNPLTVVGITFLVGTIPTLAFSWFQQSLNQVSLDSSQYLGVLAVSLGGAVVSLVLQAIIQGSLVRATLAYARGERATIAESLAASTAVVLPLIGLAILSALGVGFGFVLLIVPGIILYVMWSVAAPALVAERIGVIEAFGRSRYLTRGARWQVFGLELILVVAYWIFIGTLGVWILGAGGLNSMDVSDGLPIWWLVSNAILSTIATMVWSTVQAALYVELRDWKEGLPEEALHEIFA